MVVPFASFETRQTPHPISTRRAGCLQDALRCCALFVENNYTALDAPGTATRRQPARYIKPVEIGS